MDYYIDVVDVVTGKTEVSLHKLEMDPEDTWEVVKAFHEKHPFVSSEIINNRYDQKYVFVKYLSQPEVVTKETYELVGIYNEGNLGYYGHKLEHYYTFAKKDRDRKEIQIFQDLGIILK